MAESLTSADEAQQNAAYEALTKTYYAYYKIPDLLKNFKHNSEWNYEHLRFIYINESEFFL